MAKKKITLYFIILSVLLPALALSQMQEIKDYKVKSGDTLWDISGGELNDPFLWPKVWKENPDISNPDRIYPDQIIKIPLYLLKMPEKPVPMPVVKEEPVEEKEEIVMPVEPVKPSYLVDKNVLMASGYIAESVPSVGKIAGSPTGRNLFGNGDRVYVKTDDSANIGDKFYILRAGEMVTHPITKAKMGYVIEILGIAEIKKFEYEETIAQITTSFKEILTDDLIDTFVEIDQPLAAESYRKPYIDGYIIATQNLRIMNSSSDIVFIDKGTNDDIETGDILKTVSVGKHKIPNGAIQVINSQDTTATAIVRQSSEPIRSGNIITHFE
jgi:hypothetical protein